MGLTNVSCVCSAQEPQAQPAHRRERLSLRGARQLRLRCRWEEALQLVFELGEHRVGVPIAWKLLDEPASLLEQGQEVLLAWFS